LAGAIPWFEAIGVVPVGILFGLDPVLTVLAASVGNIITIALFAYAGDRIRNWVIERRTEKGHRAQSRVAMRRRKRPSINTASLAWRHWDQSSLAPSLQLLYRLQRELSHSR
jgi:hypothetical protein